MRPFSQLKKTHLFRFIILTDLYLNPGIAGHLDDSKKKNVVDVENPAILLSSVVTERLS